MDYNQLIRNWHTRASDEDYFSKYVFEYLAFIGFLRKVKFTSQNSDFNAVRELKRDTRSESLYIQKVETTPELIEAWQQIKVELDGRSLGVVDENNGQVRTIWYWECSHAGTHTSKEASRKHKCDEQGRIRDLNDWKNMVEFWHSIRNNLFHASKDPQDKRDRILVENGYKTLRPLVEILLATQSYDE